MQGITGMPLYGPPKKHPFDNLDTATAIQLAKLYSKIVIGIMREAKINMPPDNLDINTADSFAVSLVKNIQNANHI